MSPAERILWSSVFASVYAINVKDKNMRSADVVADATLHATMAVGGLQAKAPNEAPWEDDFEDEDDYLVAMDLWLLFNEE